LNLIALIVVYRAVCTVPGAQLLAKSLAEEENADNLLTQIARELMGQARTGSPKAPKLVGAREED
jgi:hypothetical protein